MAHARIVLLMSITALVSCRSGIPTLQEGIDFYRQNQIEQAKEIFEARATSGSVDALTLAYLADSYRRTGSPERAVETARRALLIDPCFPSRIV